MVRYSKSIVEVRWVWTEPAVGFGLTLPRIFERWHRGKLLGMLIDGLWFDEQQVDSKSVERLNWFLEGDGARRASLLSHFEAQKLLADVLQCGGCIGVGNAGGGRWPSGTTAEEILRYARESV